jgi:hypothetical protein
MKKYTSESIRVRANEAMLNSKGFMLFVVGVDGSLETVGDTTELNSAERRGLNDYRKCDAIETNNADSDF